MKPFPVPYEMEEGSRVLVAGCGGGYDVVCALPIALELRRLGHTVHLASYGFTELTRVGGSSSRDRASTRFTRAVSRLPTDTFPRAS